MNFFRSLNGDRGRWGLVSEWGVRDWAGVAGVLAVPALVWACVGTVCLSPHRNEGDNLLGPVAGCRSGISVPGPGSLDALVCVSSLPVAACQGLGPLALLSFHWMVMCPGVPALWRGLWMSVARVCLESRGAGSICEGCKWARQNAISRRLHLTLSLLLPSLQASLPR
ncbi:hypothetical protein AMECASPLE_011911 [Ameca splendens]|uniref:Uncharacterized protein n=1 Tax=Ameca splendens TaxID=208324 RepID=A0ABV0XQ05_9TELE